MSSENKIKLEREALYASVEILKNVFDRFDFDTNSKLDRDEFSTFASDYV